jgi:hypothetical protein
VSPAELAAAYVAAADAAVPLANLAEAAYCMPFSAPYYLFAHPTSICSCRQTVCQCQ